MNNNVTKVAAGAAAVVAIGIGAAVVGSASSNDSTTRNAAFGGAPGAQQGPPGASGQRNQQAGAMPPGFGTPATGADAEKAKQAALAKHPGTVERVTKQDDGGYVVHVITSDGSGELHVQVDADFNVTGTEAGGRGGPPPGGVVPPGSSSGTVETN